MFKELFPILRQRAVMMSILHLEDDTLRVSVIPKLLKEGENSALTEPFSIEGSAEELDTQLPEAIINYTTSHLQLKSTLEQAQATIAAAAAEAKKDAAAKSRARQLATKSGTTGNEPTAKNEPVKPEPAKTTHVLPGLFDPPTEPAGKSDTAMAAVPARSEEITSSELAEQEHMTDMEEEDDTHNHPA